jgi:hypothetical protein
MNMFTINIQVPYRTRIFRFIEISRACRTHGERKNTYMVLVETPEEKKLRRHKRMWEHNIKKNLREI